MENVIKIQSDCFVHIFTLVGVNITPTHLASFKSQLESAMANPDSAIVVPFEVIYQKIELYKSNKG